MTGCRDDNAIRSENDVTSDDERRVRLTIPAKAEYIALCRLALAGLARMVPVPDESLADLKLALTEACSNSVRHAYQADGAGIVEVIYRLGTDRLVIEVLDEGKGFNPEEVGGDARELDESGLGLAIIRSVTDELEVLERSDGAGSLIRFTKVLAA